MRGLTGGIYRFCEWIMRLTVTNLLWIMCALPFFWLLLVLPQTIEKPPEMVTVLILMAAVAPFTLFPATSAMFSVARKWVTGDGDAPLFRTFFKGYRQNYLQSMLGGLIYLVMAVLLYINWRFYGSMPGALGYLNYLVLSLIVVVTLSVFYFFSILSHLHMKLFQIIKNALLITIGNPLRAIMLGLINFTIFYVSSMFTFLIPFFMGSFIAIASFWQFNLMFDKMQEQKANGSHSEDSDADSNTATETDSRDAKEAVNAKEAADAEGAADAVRANDAGTAKTDDEAEQRKTD